MIRQGGEIYKPVVSGALEGGEILGMGTMYYGVLAGGGEEAGEYEEVE